MRRWLAGLAASALLSATLAACLHRHADASPHDDCALCLACAQSARHAPADSPATEPRIASRSLPQTGGPRTAAVRPWRAPARAPPTA